MNRFCTPEISVQGDDSSGKTKQETRISTWKELTGLVTEFSQNTTMHGFANLFKKREKPNPLKWKNVMFLLAIMTCFVFLGMNLYTLGKDFLDYPVTTSIVQEHRDFIEMPAVTLCQEKNDRVRHLSIFNYDYDIVRQHSY